MTIIKWISPLVAVAAGIAACGSDTDAPSSSARPAPSATSSRSPSDGDRAYRDGEYRASGEYGGLPSNIGVRLTLEDGVITDVEVTPTATIATSRDFQDRFAEAVPALVEGRNIDDVELSRVAGSSGTPDGFNAALDQIKEQAAP